MPKISESDQHAPFSVQIELVEGCNFMCDFCGINGIRKGKGYEYAKLATVERVAKEMARLGWQSRIEFAMHGEPSLHPQMRTAIQVVRKHLPAAYLLMVSNGTGFLKKTRGLDRVFQAGLNVLALDDYREWDVVKKVVKKIKRNWPGTLIRYYPQDRKASIHQKRKADVHEVVVVSDPRAVEGGNHAVLFNHTGCAFPLDDSKKHARCAFPFRDLSVRWNGAVAICCDDFRGKYRIGNIHNMTLDNIWLHPRFRAARRKLYHRQRDFGPCKGCNAVSYRVGLLPDPTGQEEMLYPGKIDAKHIKEAMADGPCSDIVLRPWEK